MLKVLDDGLKGVQRCLQILAQNLKVPFEDDVIRRAFPRGDLKDVAVEEVMIAVKKLKLRASFQKVEDDFLADLEYPFLAVMPENKFVILASCNEDHVVLIEPEAPKPFMVKRKELWEVWQGEAVFVERPFSWSALAQKYYLNWFLPIILRYKSWIYEMVTATLLLQVLGLVMPLLTQVVVDKVIPNKGISTLNVLLFSVLILILFDKGMSILRTYLFVHTTNKIDVLLGTKLFRHLVNLPLQYFDNRRVGDTMMRIGAMGSIRSFLTGSVITSLLDALFSVVFIAVMFYYSPFLAWISLMMVPICLVQNLIITPIYKEKLMKVWAAGAASNAFVVEAVTGMQTVKALAIEPQFVSRWEKLLSKHIHTAFDNSIFMMGVSSITGFVQRLVTLAILFFGGHMVIDMQMTLGQLIAFQMIASQGTGKLLALINMWQPVQQTALAAERFGDILSTKPEMAYIDRNQKKLEQVKGELILKDISFRYALAGELVLKNINLQINAGQFVGFVGRSGSGKSTMAKLIQRLYIPEYGTVYVDGLDASKIDTEVLRRQMGVVLQENYLFSGSIRDNISLAMPGASMDVVINAAKLAGAHEFILELSEGYDTEVGERGAKLSGGQRQRIAIARAMITDPKVVIFDEATSALDYKSEREIMTNMSNICQGRTVIMIAHRLLTVQNCDVIYVFERGEIVEQGTHEELLAKKGYYYNLYLLQEG